MKALGSICLFSLLLLVDCGNSKRALDAPPAAPEESSSGMAEGPAAPEVGPSDPPYTSEVIYPSGLRLSGLVRDPELTRTYPDPGTRRFPFSSDRIKHYVPVEFFIDISTLPKALRQEKITSDFTLEQYLRLPERNGDSRPYIDAEITFHVQELRNAWGASIRFSSTYRSPAFNRRIGGAFFSRHMYGDAADVQPFSSQRVQVQNLYNLARLLEVSFLEPASRTIGRNVGWVHIDDRGWSLNTPATR